MITEDPFKQIISKISRNEEITKTEADMAFSLIINGSVTDAQIGAFLMGLSLKREREQNN